jgi:hypothetical protein
MGNFFTSQATISFSERIMIHVLVGFHTSDPEITLFPTEVKGREAIEVNFRERWLGTLLGGQHGAAVQKEMGVLHMAVNICRFDVKTDVFQEHLTNMRPK